MPKYLIDANLPYHFSLWEGDEYVHVKDIDDQWSDTQIWNYARERDLTIITKDADFSDRNLLVGPPPRVIHIRLGNMRMQAFHQEISRIWDENVELSKQYALARSLSDLGLIYCGKGGFGQIFRSFSLNSYDYSPQTIEKSASNYLSLATIA